MRSKGIMSLLYSFILGIVVFSAMQCGGNANTETEPKDESKNRSRFGTLKQDSSKPNAIPNEPTKNPDNINLPNDKLDINQILNLLKQVVNLRKCSGPDKENANISLNPISCNKGINPPHPLENINLLPRKYKFRNRSLPLNHPIPSISNKMGPVYKYPNHKTISTLRTKLIMPNLPNKLISANTNTNKGQEEKEEDLIKDTMIKIVSADFWTPKDMESLREDFTKLIDHIRYYVRMNDIPSYIDDIYLNYITKRDKYWSRCKSKILGTDTILYLKILETIDKYSKIEKMLKYKPIQTIDDLNTYYKIFIGISSFIGVLKKINASIRQMKALEGHNGSLNLAMEHLCGGLDDLNKNINDINRSSSNTKLLKQFFKKKLLTYKRKNRFFEKEEPRAPIVLEVDSNYMRQTKDYMYQVYDNLEAMHADILNKANKKDFIDKQQYATTIIIITSELKIEMQMVKSILYGIFCLNTKECANLRYDFVKNYIKTKSKYVEAMKVRNEIVKILQS